MFCLQKLLEGIEVEGIALRVMRTLRKTRPRKLRRVVPLVFRFYYPVCFQLLRELL